MLVFLYEKCRAESRGRTGEKPDEYSYRYGRWTVVPEASSTILDSEPMLPVCLPEIKLRVSLETNWDRVESRWSIRQAATLARQRETKPSRKAPVPKNIGNRVKGGRTSIQPPRKATSNPPALIMSIPTRINP